MVRLQIENSHIRAFIPWRFTGSQMTRLMVLITVLYFLFLNPIVLAASNILGFNQPGLLGAVAIGLACMVVASYLIRFRIAAQYIDVATVLFWWYTLALVISFAISSKGENAIWQLVMFITYSAIPWIIGSLAANTGVKLNRLHGAVVLLLVILTLALEWRIAGQAGLRYRPGELVGNPLSLALAGVLGTLVLADSTGKRGNVLNIDFLSLGAAIVFLTSTRRAFVGLFIAMVVHLMLRGGIAFPRSWWRYALLGFSAVLLLTAVDRIDITSFARWNITFNALREGTPLDPVRVQLAARGFDSFAEMPLFGNWDYVTRGDYAHNAYIDILGRTGVFGGTPFILLSMWVGLQALRLRGTSHHVWVLFYVVALSSGLIASTSFADPVFWLVAGYIVRTASHQRVRASCAIISKEKDRTLVEGGNIERSTPS